MSSPTKLNVWPRTFIIDVKVHSILIHAVIESFNLAVYPGHHFFGAKTIYYPCCTDSVNVLQDAKQVLRNALRVLVPQIDCDLDNEAW